MLEKYRSYGQNVGQSGSQTSGFGIIRALLVVLLLSMLGYAAWQVFKTKDGAIAEYSVLSETDTFDDESGVVMSFYGCVDRVKDFTPTLPQTCTYAERVFTRPIDFTQDNIRNFNRLPASAKPTVTAIAKKNFDICKDAPETFSVTRILGVVEGYVHLATGCDGGYAAIMIQQGGGWRELNLGQGRLTCDVADENNIPKALLIRKDDARSATCLLDNGKLRSLDA